MTIYKVTFETGSTVTVSGALTAQNAMQKAEDNKNAPIYVGHWSADLRAREDDTYTSKDGFLIVNKRTLATSAKEMREVWMDCGYCIVPVEA